MQPLTHAKTNIKEAVLDMAFGYDPREYFPVFVDGELSNKSQFVQYKAQRARLAVRRAIRASLQRG